MFTQLLQTYERIKLNMTFNELISFLSPTFIGLYQYSHCHLHCQHSQILPHHPFHLLHLIYSTFIILQLSLMERFVAMVMNQWHSFTHWPSFLFKLVSEHSPLPRAIQKTVVSDDPFETYYSLKCVVMRSSHQ